MVFGLALLVLSGLPSLWLLMLLLRKLWAPHPPALAARSRSMARVEAAAAGVLRFAAVLGSIGAGFCLLGAVSAVAPLWVFLVLALWLLGCARLLAMRRSGVILVCASGW